MAYWKRLQSSQLSAHISCLSICCLTFGHKWASRPYKSRRKGINPWYVIDNKGNVTLEASQAAYLEVWGISSGYAQHITPLSMPPLWICLCPSAHRGVPPWPRLLQHIVCGCNLRLGSRPLGPALRLTSNYSRLSRWPQRILIFHCL